MPLTSYAFYPTSLRCSVERKSTVARTFSFALSVSISDRTASPLVRPTNYEVYLAVACGLLVSNFSIHRSIRHPLFGRCDLFTFFSRCTYH